MSDAIPITVPCSQFPGSEVTLEISPAAAAQFDFPLCEDIYFADLQFLADRDPESPVDEILNDDENGNMEVDTYAYPGLEQEVAHSTLPDVGFHVPFKSHDEEEEEDYEKDEKGENSVTSESYNAILEYKDAFPDGYEIIPTPSSGLLCGFNAVIRSMQAQQHYVPCPTVESLQEVLYWPAFVEHATAFGMANENNFSVDQVGAVLFFWGLEFGLNLRIGYLAEGEAPRLLPHPNEEPAYIVWIHNDNCGNEATGALGHFSGMEPVF